MSIEAMKQAREFIFDIEWSLERDRIDRLLTEAIAEAENKDDELNELKSNLNWAEEQLKANTHWYFVAHAKEEMLKACWQEIKTLKETIAEAEKQDDEVLGFNGWGFPIEEPNKESVTWTDKAFERLCEQWNHMTSEEFAIVQRFLFGVYAHAPQLKPHPDCDSGCMYVCTEGFSKQPKCENKENNDE